MQPPNAVDEIRKLKPHHLLVTIEGDEEPRKIAVPNVRNRWERIATLLDTMTWTNIEARSKDGGTLAMLTPPTDGASSTSGNRTDDVHTIRERDLLDLLDRANDRAVARALEAQSIGTQRYEALATLMFEGVRNILDVVTTSTRAVTAQFTQALTLSAQGGADDGIGGLRPLFDTMRDLKDKPTTKPKPNGAKPNGAKPNGAKVAT
jgi:hypothetical protein